ncbi:hypothetical protein [Chromobacterium sp. ATCC 53434]|uniref:hypothetical protein n=1 Tax=Chromobacterium sp. (strain ATCC 53434 / SC 14030) TaxID=2059672 RepID=UPI001305296B|nr:hypothetical protein [Chromobacterium sp. ATCC 53434]
MSSSRRNNISQQFWFIQIVAILIGCLVCKPVRADDATTGATLANRLTSLYRQGAATCEDTLPLCAGLLIREVSALPTNGKTWYLHADAASSTNPFTAKPDLTGLVFPADAGQQTTRPYCALPGAPTDENRTAYGCWPATEADHTGDSDRSSCSDLLVKYGGDVTMSNWLKRNADKQPACSFSVQHKTEFQQALLTSAHQSAPLLLPMPEWPASALDPANLPTRAVVYAAGSNQGKANAETLQQTLENEGVHVLRVALDTAKGEFRYEPTVVIPSFDMSALRKLILDGTDTKLDFYLSGTSNHQSPTIFTNNGYLQLHPATSFGVSGSRMPAYGLIKDGSRTKGIFYVPTHNITDDANLIYALKYQATKMDTDHQVYPIFKIDTGGQDAISPTGSISIISQINVSGPNPYATMVAKIKELNIRFNSKISGCGLDEHGGKKPAFFCSGLIMRSTNHISPLPNAMVASHYFIRADTHTINQWAAYVGIILKPTTELAKNWLKCIYPRDAATWFPGARTKENYLCSGGGSAIPANVNDPSSCSHALLGLGSGATAAEWAAAFQNKYPSTMGESQCSFSVQDANQFAAAIQVSGTNVAKNFGYSWNELIVKPWTDASIPEIEAIFWTPRPDKKFYDEDFDKANALANQYKLKTNKLVPVVKVDLFNNVVSMP